MIYCHKLKLSLLIFKVYNSNDGYSKWWIIKKFKNGCHRVKFKDLSKKDFLGGELCIHIPKIRKSLRVFHGNKIQQKFNFGNPTWKSCSTNAMNDQSRLASIFTYYQCHHSRFIKWPVENGPSAVEFQCPLMEFGQSVSVNLFSFINRPLTFDRVIFAVRLAKRPVWTFAMKYLFLLRHIPI